MIAYLLENVAPEAAVWLRNQFRSLAPEDIEEILSEAAFKIWTSSSSFDEERGSLSGFYYVICKSRALDLLRSHGHRVARLKKRGLDTITYPVSPRPNDEVLTPLMLDFLRIIESLAPIDQRVLRDSVLGHTHHEIAEKIGSTVGAVRVRAHRLRRRIKEQLILLGHSYSAPSSQETADLR